MLKTKKPEGYLWAWRRLHPFTYRAGLLGWYYKNRKRINLMFSLPRGREDDEADKWLAEKEGITTPSERN
ncbi:hypothetical protein HZB78_05515 [Candidatus Collierbacteria bacterium]|nr:hypothetical protein [Candidatus Collierbacteria bacterium]